MSDLAKQGRELLKEAGNGSPYTNNNVMYVSDGGRGLICGQPRSAHTAAESPVDPVLLQCRDCGGSGGGDEPHLTCRRCRGSGLDPTPPLATEFAGPPTPQHEHTDSCFGPNYSHCPSPPSATREMTDHAPCGCSRAIVLNGYHESVRCSIIGNHRPQPSATRDEERERLIEKFLRYARSCTGWDFEKEAGHYRTAAAMLEADGKALAAKDARIAELARELAYARGDKSNV